LFPAVSASGKSTFTRSFFGWSVGERLSAGTGVTGLFETQLSAKILLNTAYRDVLFAVYERMHCSRGFTTTTMCYINLLFYFILFSFRFISSNVNFVSVIAPCFCSNDVTLFFFDITCNSTHLSWSMVEEIFNSMSSEEFNRMFPLELSEDDDCVPGTRASSSVRLCTTTCASDDKTE